MAVEVSITQFFTTCLIIFLKPHALVKEKKHGIPSLDKAPLPFHTRLVLPHIHWNLDPNPRTIWCNNSNKKGTRYQLKENCKIQCKMGNNTCFARVLPLFYLLNLEDKEVLTSAFIISWNSSSSLFKICLYFSISSAMMSSFPLQYMVLMN